MGLHWERGREQQTLLKRYNRLIFPLFSPLSHSPFLFLHFQLQSTHCHASYVNTVLSHTHSHTHWTLDDVSFFGCCCVGALSGFPRR